MPAKKQPPARTTKGNTYGEVAEHRLRDCRALLGSQRWDAAVYLAGYVIECRLKYAITQWRGVKHLPPDYAGGRGHEWDILLNASGLEPNLEASQVKNAWSVLRDEWQTAMRYKVNQFSRTRAETLCKMVADVYHWLKEACP